MESSGDSPDSDSALMDSPDSDSALMDSPDFGQQAPLSPAPQGRPYEHLPVRPPADQPCWSVPLLLVSAAGWWTAYLGEESWAGQRPRPPPVLPPKGRIRVGRPTAASKASLGPIHPSTGGRAPRQRQKLVQGPARARPRPSLGSDPTPHPLLPRNGATIASGRRASGRIASGRRASGRIASGRIASGRRASGRIVSGIIASGRKNSEWKNSEWKKSDPSSTMRPWPDQLRDSDAYRWNQEVTLPVGNATRRSCYLYL